MKKFALLFLGSFLLSSPANSQIVVKKPLSIRQTYYKIDAKLDTVRRVVKGRMETYRVNKSTDVVPDVKMHLYMNSVMPILWGCLPAMSSRNLGLMRESISSRRYDT